jgi:hypothetical protein
MQWLGWVLLPILALWVATSAGELQPNQTFSQAEILPYYYLCAASYCSNTSTVAVWDCPSCLAFPNFKLVSTFYNTSTNIFAYVGLMDATAAAGDMEIVVVFRGTQFESLTNWIYNLNFPKTVPYRADPSATVHEGFFEDYESVHAGVEFWVRSMLLSYPQARITITGHSLGGAMATLCATELKFNISPLLNITVITFGSPRVGNLDYAVLFDTLVNATWRTTHYRDIVPHLPPRMTSGPVQFWHVAQETWYTVENSTEYYVCDQSGEDPDGADSVWLGLSIYDHIHYLNLTIECPLLDPPPPPPVSKEG